MILSSIPTVGKMDQSGILLLAMMFLIMHTPATEGSAKVLVDLRHFENPGSLQYDGRCCDGEVIRQNCTGICDYGVTLCLGTAYDALCSLASLNLGYLESMGTSFTFPDTFHDGYANPVPIELDIWNGSVLVTVKIFDHDTATTQLVDIFSFEFFLASPIKRRIPTMQDYTAFDLIGTRDILPARLTVGVTARCDRFFYTDACNVNCVASDDCHGHYTCDVADGRKLCLQGWGGEDCNVSLSEERRCSNDYCHNGGECVPYGNSTGQAYCCCLPGYSGDTCGQDVDECASGPCLNGGLCVQKSPPLFSCVCTAPWKGQFCEEPKTCDDNPCLNGGRCQVLRRRQETFYCLCDQTSFTGELCEIRVTTTAPTPPPTTTTTTTTTATQSTTIATEETVLPSQCYGNYFGQSCRTHCRPTDDCTGHYTCQAATGHKICRPGWTQESNCTRSTVQDRACVCENEGQCFDDVCCCPLGFTGPLCTQVSTGCLRNPCRNGGTCRVNFISGLEECVCPEMLAGSRCESMLAPNRNCPPGLFGPDCETRCVPEYSCGLGRSGQYYCDEITGARVCMFGWTGPLCDLPAQNAQHPQPCPNSVCRNGGACVNGTCCCAPGYTGTLCHIEILECERRPCLNGASCIESINSYQCRCTPGFVGLNCEIQVAASGSENTPPPTLGPANTRCFTVFCRNGGTCVPNGVASFYCLCADRFFGLLCENFVADSRNNQSCPEFYHGPNCAVRCEESDSCDKGHFYCDQTTGDKICRSGWDGEACNIRLLAPEVDPECPVLGPGCRNSGFCFAGSCCCPTSHNGRLCEKEILPCNRQAPGLGPPCGNHGDCLDGEGSNFTCRCRDGFSGSKCENNPLVVTDQAATPPTVTVQSPATDEAQSSYASVSTTNSLAVPGVTESTTLTTPEVATTEVFLRPVQCASFSCYNGGYCYFTSLGEICICPRDNMGRFCQIIQDNDSTASLSSSSSEAPSSPEPTMLQTYLSESATISTGLAPSSPSSPPSAEPGLFQTSVSELSAISFYTASSATTAILDNTDIIASTSLSFTTSKTPALPSSKYIAPTPSLSSYTAPSLSSYTAPGLFPIRDQTSSPTPSSSVFLSPSPEPYGVSTASRSTNPSDSFSSTSSTSFLHSPSSTPLPTQPGLTGFTRPVGTPVSVTADQVLPSSPKSEKSFLQDSTSAQITPSPTAVSEAVHMTASPSPPSTGVPAGSVGDANTTLAAPGVQGLHQGVVFLTGPVHDEDLPTLVDRVQDAITTSSPDMVCCLKASSDRGSLYFGDQGERLVRLDFSYTATLNSPSAEASQNQREDFDLQPESRVYKRGHGAKVLQTSARDESILEIDNLLGQVPSFRAERVHVYIGPVYGPAVLFTVDAVGPVDRHMVEVFETSIELAWMDQTPDCDCLFEARVLNSDPFIGRYGTQLQRLYYIMIQNGELQSMTSSLAPANQLLSQEFSLHRLNKHYVHSEDALSSSYLFSVPLSTVLTLNSQEGRKVGDALTSTWRQHFAGDHNTSVSVIRPQLHYTDRGADISNVEYFVIVGGVAQHPSIESVPSESTLQVEIGSCDCQHKPTLSLRVKGRANYFTAEKVIDQITGHGQLILREWFYDLNGNLVTQIYFKPNFFNTAVNEDGLSSGSRNYTSGDSTLETLAPGTRSLLRRRYQAVLQGQVSDVTVRSGMTGRLAAAWESHNTGIPFDVFKISIEVIDRTSFVQETGLPVTVLYYTVAVDGADSSFTSAEEPLATVLRQQFDLSSSDLMLCDGCGVRKLHTLQVHLKRYNVTGDELTSALTAALQDAWAERNPEFVGTILVGIHSISEHPKNDDDKDDEKKNDDNEFHSSKLNNKAMKSKLEYEWQLNSSMANPLWHSSCGESPLVLYNINRKSPNDSLLNETAATIALSLNLLGGQTGVSDLDLHAPKQKDLNLVFQRHGLGVAVMDSGEDAGNDDSDDFPWYIPVGVILALFLIGIIVVVFLLITRDARRRDSRHVRQEAEGIVDYDKEHFAREPDIPNPTFAPEDADFEDGKTGTYSYYVNPYQTAGGGGGGGGAGPH